MNNKTLSCPSLEPIELIFLNRRIMKTTMPLKVVTEIVKTRNKVKFVGISLEKRASF